MMWTVEERSENILAWIKTILFDIPLDDLEAGFNLSMSRSTPFGCLLAETGGPTMSARPVAIRTRGMIPLENR